MWQYNNNKITTTRCDASAAQLRCMYKSHDAQTLANLRASTTQKQHNTQNKYMHAKSQMDAKRNLEFLLSWRAHEKDSQLASQ